MEQRKNFSFINNMSLIKVGFQGYYLEDDDSI